MKLEIPSVAPRDVTTLHRWLLEAFRRAGDAWGGRVLLRAAVGTEETGIAHGLTERPLAVFWSQDGVVRVGRTRADDDRRVYLRASTATIVDLLVIPGFSREIAGTIAPLDADIAVTDAGVEPEPEEPSAAQVTIRGFRSLDPGGAFAAASTRIHWAGLHASNAGVWVDSVGSNALQAAAGGMAYAYSEYFEENAIINRLVISTRGRGGAAGGNVRLGVYSNTTLASGSFAGTDYPGTLLGESANLAYPAGADSLMESVGLSIPATAREKRWFVFVQDAAGVTGAYSLFGYARGALFPFLGFTIDAVSPTTIPQDNATAGVCWRHSITYTGTESFPSTFPQTSPVVGVQAAAGTIVHPAVGFGRQAA